MAQPGGDDGLTIDATQQKKSKNGGPRKRVSQACDRCRSRKDKCDGQKPSCSTCTANGRECSYDANVKKRGLPTNYVRGMEKLWGLAIREVEDVEEDILQALGPNEDGKSETALNVWNDETNSESWVDTWRKSQIFQGLERLLSSQEPLTENLSKVGSDNVKRKRVDSNTQGEKRNWLAGPQQYATPHYGSDAGQDQGWTEASSDMIPSHGQDFAGQQVGNKSEKNYGSILSPPNRPAINPPPASTADLPELPSETWHLLDVYFSYTHSWLPIIEKHDLLRISYQYSRSRVNSLEERTSDHAVLWATIAYAKFQHRAINNIPRALGSVGEMVWTAEKMYSIARSLIPNEEGVLEIGHLQALLVLTLANYGMGYLGRAWLLVGQAVRIAIDLKLDQPSDQVLTASKATSRARHVFLGCFVLDTLIAARSGRRPHLRTADVDIVGLLEEDGLEEWDPWTDCLNVKRAYSGNSRLPASVPSTFNRLIQVLRILNDIVSTTDSKPQFSERLVEQLQTWSQSQPPGLCFDSNPMDEQARSLLPHQLHLHTAYFTTLVASRMLSHNNGVDIANLEACARSARHVAGFCIQHSKGYGLLIVPPTYEYFMNSAYDVINAVHSSIESTHIILNDWKRSLDNCLEAMEPAWPVLETLRSTVGSSVQPDRRHSQVAFDLISGTSQDGDTGKTPQSVASYEALNHRSPGFPRQAEASRQSLSTSHSKKVPTPQMTHQSPSSGQSTGHGLPQNPLNMYENAHAIYGVRSAASAPTGTVQMATPGQTSLQMGQHPNLHHARSIGSDVDMTDTGLNEFMRLDATEWTGTWNQGLANLGFTDRDNVNQDFYDFCQEPDPLHADSIVFQQLMANSNAEATDFFNGSAFGGIGMGIGMGLGEFGGMGYGDENEGIEAGQILQALSAASDQMPSQMPNG